MDKRILATILLLLCISPFANAQTYTLDQVLAKMNDVNKTFRAMQASVERTDFNYLLRDTPSGEEKQYGTVIFKRPKNGEARVRFDFTIPQRTVIIGDGMLQDYNPKTKTLSKQPLTGVKNPAELLMFGFGASGDQMKQTYDVSLIGDETLDGQKTSVIELKPKSAEAKKDIESIRLWVDQKRWIPVQAKLFEHNRDVLTAKFTNIKLTGDVSDSAFKLNLPKDTQIIH